MKTSRPDGSVPNNWVNNFHPGQPAWTFDETTGQYYLNHFLASQPDLNWWNEDVRDEFDRILRFWFDRGVAGFRIIAHMQVACGTADVEMLVLILTIGLLRVQPGKT